ncbi:MAG TPA: hypothetical protein VJI15_04110 [Candidatus Nanoarchaeia archaeon]|nr:hypothetical protein [Candidatus Nanoarchaeia archaeon]
MAEYLCVLIQEYGALVSASVLPPERRTFGSRSFLCEGENPREALDALLMASGGTPYIAAVFNPDARVLRDPSRDPSFAEMVEGALLAGKFNERAVRDYRLPVKPNIVIVRER